MIKRTKDIEAMILGIVGNCRVYPKRLFTQDDKLRLLSKRLQAKTTSMNVKIVISTSVPKN